MLSYSVWLTVSHLSSRLLKPTHISDISSKATLILIGITLPRNTTTISQLPSRISSPECSPSTLRRESPLLRSSLTLGWPKNHLALLRKPSISLRKSSSKQNEERSIFQSLIKRESPFNPAIYRLILAILLFQFSQIFST